MVLNILLTAPALCGGFAYADTCPSLDPSTPTASTNTLPTEGRWELCFGEKPALFPTKSDDDIRSFTVDSRARYASHIQAAAIANNVDAALIRAVITAESSDNPSAVSRAGAVGLMQLMPAIAKRYNVTNSRDPGQNIHGGTKHLRDLMRMFNNNVHLVLAAYNAGEQAVMKYGNRIPPYRETLAYVSKVLKFYNQYRTGHTSARESAQSPIFTASRKAGTQTRVSRTYIANPA